MTLDSKPRKSLSTPTSEDAEGLHLLSVHLKTTGSLAIGFLSSPGFSELAHAAGLLHDLGKRTPSNHPADGTRIIHLRRPASE